MWTMICYMVEVDERLNKIELNQTKMSKGEWIFEYKNHTYHLQDRDDSFKKGDLFFERSGRLGPIEWDGKEQLNYHCKKMISIKPKQR